MTEFYDRTEWDAAPPVGGFVNRSLDRVTGAVLHYTAMAPPPTPEGAFGQVRGIQRFHQKTRGWRDIAYHRLVDPWGNVFEGRPLTVIGGHTSGNNTPLIGYCFLTDGPLTSEAWAGCVTQIAADQDVIGRAYGTIEPHSAYVATACPGDVIRAQLAGAGPPGAAPGPAPAPLPPPAPVYVPPFAGRLITQPPLMVGADVHTWQSQMAARGWRIGVDGKYGPGSEDVCRRFQAEKGLTPDGIVGPVTWDATWTAPVT